MKLKIKPEDIEGADRDRPGHCPVARALNRRYGRRDAWVGADAWRWGKLDNIWYVLSPDVISQIREYDRGGEWTLTEVEL